MLPGYKNDAAFLSGRSRQLCILEFQAGVINVQTERIGKRRHRLLWSQTRTVMANSRDENDLRSCQSGTGENVVRRCEKVDQRARAANQSRLKPRHFLFHLA